VGVAVVRSHPRNDDRPRELAPRPLPVALFLLHLAPVDLGPELRSEVVFENGTPGKSWFYQPTEACFDRSWPLPDFEHV
jgi:hypothetical protein